jgi:hypothetical protein
MSLSRTPSLTNIPAQVVNPQKEKQDSLSPDSKKNQHADAGETDHSTQASKNSTTDQKNSDKKSTPVKQLQPPVVRQKLMKRERSVSSPVIQRPMLLPSSSNPVSPKTEIASSPRLQSKRSEVTPKVLTPQQQLASDLADLIEKVILRKKGRLDDEIDMSQATLSLQRQFDKTPNGKLFIENMTLNMFSDDLKKTEAWSIAQNIIASIRINYFKGQDFSGEIDPIKKNEVTGMLSLLASSFAGAFFNISGTASTNRLPESLMFFLREIDCRHIRILLSDGKGIALSENEFLRSRRDWMAKILIDAFLVPLVQKEFFAIRGALSTDKIVSQIISALHSAFAISAPEILSQSLKSAPDDILELEKKRRTTQFKPRRNHLEKSPGNGEQGQKKSISPGRSILAGATSPSRQRRSELSKLLKNLVEELARENAQLTPAMLVKIKSFNNDFALSNQPLSKAFLYQAWFAAAARGDRHEKGGDDKSKNEKLGSAEVHANALKVLKRIVDEAVEIENEQSVLTKDLLEIELFTKLTEMESSGKPINLERAMRLSRNMPLNPISMSPSSYQKSPTTSSSTVSITSSGSSTSKSPTAVRLQQHRRVRTADVSPVKFGDVPERLTEQERDALINAYPDLILGGIQKAAYKKIETGFVLRNDPIKGIITASRNKFPIPLEKLTKVLRQKIKVLNALPDDATTISHAELLKTLMLEQFKLSTAGNTLISGRTTALQSSGKSQKTNFLDDQTILEAEKNRLQNIFKEPVEQITASLFNANLSQFTIPQSLLTLWKNFDQKLVDWARNDLKASSEDLEILRSTLGFDLIVTRLVYPLCIGIGDANPSLAATSFADAVRQSTLKKWDLFFQAFKQA